MAKSNSHTLGEMIGNFFEEVMKSPINQLCNNHNVYFDSIGPRKARRRKKITWEDINGSKHDLDYVIERDGTETQIGIPIAFIELAWRRYTKHSKNKVQEIAGAVLPIAEKYCEYVPFKGAILSGVFTKPSLEQLKKQGFNVLYIPFEKVVASFKKYGIDIYYDEKTSEDDLDKIITAWEHSDKIGNIKQDFINENQKEIDKFLNALELSIKRQIKYIFVLPLHGKEVRFQEINKAIEFLSIYNSLPKNAKIDRYVVGIAFNDGSKIDCMFKDKQMAVDFLRRNGQ